MHRQKRNRIRYNTRSESLTLQRQTHAISRLAVGAAVKRLWRIVTKNVARPIGIAVVFPVHIAIHFPSSGVTF